MRKEKIKQLVDVMQAYVNGKTIQYYKVDLSPCEGFEELFKKNMERKK